MDRQCCQLWGRHDVRIGTGCLYMHGVTSTTLIFVVRNSPSSKWKQQFHFKARAMTMGCTVCGLISITVHSSTELAGGPPQGNKGQGSVLSCTYTRAGQCSLAHRSTPSLCYCGAANMCERALTCRCSSPQPRDATSLIDLYSDIRSTLQHAMAFLTHESCFVKSSP